MSYPQLERDHTASRTPAADRFGPDFPTPLVSNQIMHAGRATSAATAHFRPRGPQRSKDSMLFGPRTPSWRPSRCGSATSDSRPPINRSRRTCNSRKTLCENSSRSVNERSGSRPTPRCWPSWRASDYGKQTACWTPAAAVSPTVTCHNTMLVIPAKSEQVVDRNLLGVGDWASTDANQSGRACAEASSRPSAPRSGGRA